MKPVRVSTLRFAFSVLLMITMSPLAPAQNPQRSSDLVQQFKNESIFWRQLDIAKKIVALRDMRVLPDLEPGLTENDRHVRANVAFVFAALGDQRGLNTLKAMLEDVSYRPPSQGRTTAKTSQTQADRYYAAHVLGQLKNPKAAAILLPFLSDNDIKYKVAWALGETGEKSAIPPLIAATQDRNSDMRVISIGALVKLKAREALPRIRAMVQDKQRIHFDEIASVSQAAREAIAILEEPPWPAVEGHAVATRVTTDPAIPWWPLNITYYGECQVKYIVDGKPFFIWAAAYAFFDENVVRQKMSSCPKPAFDVRYNPKDPSDAVITRASR